MDKARSILCVTDNQSFAEALSVEIRKVVRAEKYQVTAASPGEVFGRRMLVSPILILIDLNSSIPDIPKFIEQLSALFPNQKIACTGKKLSVDDILTLVKAGVNDFLKYPLDEKEVTELFKKIDSIESQPMEKHGKIVTVCSPKGGTGVSLIASNLGVMTAGKKVCSTVLCDFDANVGDICTYLNLDAEYTIRDLIENVDKLDPSFLEGVLLHHNSGLKVLAAPRENQESLSSQSLTEVQTILSLLKRQYDLIYIDPGHADHILRQFLIMHSDLILLVGCLNVPSLKGLVVELNHLQKQQYEGKRIKIIINRYNSKDQLDIHEFEKTANHKIDSKLPNQYSLCIESVNKGIPAAQLHARAELVKKMDLILDEMLVGLGLAKQPSKHSMRIF